MNSAERKAAQTDREREREREKATIARGKETRGDEIEHEAETQRQRQRQRQREKGGGGADEIGSCTGSATGVLSRAHRRECPAAISPGRELRYQPPPTPPFLPSARTVTRKESRATFRLIHPFARIPLFIPLFRSLGRVLASAITGGRGRGNGGKSGRLEEAEGWEGRRV